MSWEARPSGPTPPGGSPLYRPVSSCLSRTEHDCPLLMTMDLYLKSFRTKILQLFLSPARGSSRPAPCSGPWWWAPSGWTAESFSLYARGAKPGDYDSSRNFLLIYLCWNVSVCFCFCFYRELRQFSANNLETSFFLMRRWSFESVPEISLPPCIGTQRRCPKSWSIKRWYVWASFMRPKGVWTSTQTDQMASGWRFWLCLPGPLELDGSPLPSRWQNKICTHEVWVTNP